MSTDAILLEVALIVTFAAGILYWVFVTPKREQDRWRKQLDVGGRVMPPPSTGAARDAEQDAGRRADEAARGAGLR